MGNPAMAGGIIVKPRSRIFHGHDWVYGSEVKKVFGNPLPGDVISLKDFKDRRLGTALYNPDSQIVARRFSRRKQELDADFFARRIQRAIDLRGRLPGVDPSICRLVWSESDGLPGVVIDRYGDHIVLQTLTLGMDRRKGAIVEALESTLAPESIVERNDSPVRKAEGLEPQNGALRGSPPAKFPVTVAGIQFEVDLLGGQKTGLYLDQADNYQQVASLAAGRRVLDTFTNQGGFALACMRAGAHSATAVDISEDAVAAVTENATRNAVAIEAVAENAFDFLKRTEAAENAEFDMIVLDPPSFTRNKKSLKDALRGYKEIHLRALKILKPGGILVTFCCSHHVATPEFRRVICAACVDAKRSIRQLAIYSQRSDHPILPTIPETEYLKGFAFEVLGSF